MRNKAKYLAIGITIGIILSSVVALAGYIDVVSEQMQYYFNEQMKSLPEDMTTLLYQDRAYVPIRFIAESLNKDVFWSDGKIMIEDKKIRNASEYIWHKDGWDYFVVSNDDKDMTVRPVQREVMIKSNGKEKIKIASAPFFSYFCIKDDLIYYIADEYSVEDNAYYLSLCSMDTDGGNKQIIETFVHDFMILGDDVYYVQYMNTGYQCNLYKMSLVRGEKQLLRENTGGEIYLNGYDNGFVYFTEEGNESVLMRMYMDGTEISPAMNLLEDIDLHEITGWPKDEPIPEALKEVCIFGFVRVYQGKVTYALYAARGVYEFDLKTRGNKCLVQNPGNFGVDANDIYYNLLEDRTIPPRDAIGSTIYRMNLDGTGKETVFEVPEDLFAYSIETSDEWIYFVLETRKSRISEDGYGSYESFSARVRKDGTGFESLNTKTSGGLEVTPDGHIIGGTWD